MSAAPNLKEASVQLSREFDAVIRIEEHDDGIKVVIDGRLTASELRRLADQFDGIVGRFLE